MRQFSSRHPRSTAFVIFALFALAFAGPSLIYGPVDLSAPSGLIDLEFLSFALRPQFAFAASVMFITFVIGWGRQTRLTTTPDRHGLWISFWIGLGLFALYGTLAALVLVEGEGADRLRILMVIVALNVMVGIFEEVLFRGILFHGLRARHSLGTAIIFSSVLFGVFHLVNLSVGQSLQITLFQVVNATAIGIFLCAIMLQANSLWPAIILHAIWNCYAMSGQLLIDTVDIPDLPAAPQITAQNFILPIIISLAAGLLLYRWGLRMARQSPPPIADQ